MFQRLENSNILDIYPLTPMQEGVYFHFLYDRLSAAFFVQLSYRIQGNISMDLVEKSLATLYRRHDVLRTVFNHEKTGKPLQIVLKEGNTETVFHDYSYMADEVIRTERLEQFKQEDKTRLFDLNRDVLMRVTVIKLAESTYEFIWSHHHILMDGWCTNLLIGEYNTIYNSLQQEKEIVLPAVRPFREYIRWLQKQDQQASAAYWKKYLHNYEGTASLPVFADTVQETVFDNRQYLLKVSPAVTVKLKKISAAFNVTLSLIMQAAWGVLLGRYKGEEDVVFGLVVSGRPADLPGVESMVGLFINTVPLRVSFKGLPFSALLIKMQHESLQGVPYSFTPLADIQADTGMGRHLLDHALVFENFPDVAASINSMAAANYGEQHIQVAAATAFEQSNYNLDIRIGFGEAEGVVLFRYNCNAYTNETIEMAAAYLETLLERITDNPHAACRELLQITDSELTFLAACEPETRDFPRERTVPGLLDEVALRFPDKPAFINGEAILTYEALFRGSNAIGHMVRACCQKDEAIVGLFMSRGVTMAEAIIGIWKAGAAYLPLDTAHPAERLRWLINDAGMKMMITNTGNLKKAQQLQWLCPSLETLFCADTGSFYSVREPENPSVRQDLWEEQQGPLHWSDSSLTATENIYAQLQPYLTPTSVVLEIGCGEGQLMARLAGEVKHYTGIDFSAGNITRNKKLAEDTGLDNVTLHHMYAHEIELLKGAAWDVIIINQAVQHFYGYNYLRSVTGKCIAGMNTSGVIFFAGVPDLEMQDAYMQWMKKEGMGEEILFLSETFFRDLPFVFPAVTTVTHQRLSSVGTFDVLLQVNREITIPSIKEPAKKQLDRSHLQVFEEQASIDFSSPQGLAYVIYTSGSTGHPKGVMVEHIGMLNHLYAKINDLAVDENSRIVQNASHTFDISVWQFFTAVLRGGTTYIYSQELILSVELFLQQLVQDCITIAEVVPSYLDVLLEEVKGQDITLPDLHYMMVTGETLPAEVAANWFSAFPRKPLVNAYGPTEASDDITHHFMQEAPVGKVPLGKAVQNMRILILDKQLRVCPPCVKGEICVTGVGVGRGYLNNPEKTSAAFIADVFDPASPYRIYKTGDIGSWLADGTLAFWGREDYQVKIRGFRIELGEIEARLHEAEGVRNAVVVDHTDDAGGKYLVAYVCAQPGLALDAAVLEKELRHRLPEYMVPEQYVFLDAIPLSSNGKTDRKKLPAPLKKGHASSFEEPRNETEAKLRHIWEQVLDYKPVSIHDNFFKLGGHSLKAMRVVSSIQKEMHVKLELRQFFMAPVLADMAALIAGQETAVMQEILPSPVQDYYPVSHAQKRMWILSQFKEASLAYNVFNTWIIKGDFRPELLEKALQAMVERHEILRTTFTSQEGEPVQRVHAVNHFKQLFHYCDFSAATDTDTAILELTREQETTAFDLEDGPLLHLLLVKKSAQEYFCLMNIHHIICDGWSLQLFFNELISIYTAYVLDKPLQLQPLKIQYRDFATWQQKLLTGASVKKFREYWHEVLRGPLPSLQLPSFLPRPELQTYNGANHGHLFSDLVYKGLQDITAAHQGSLFMTLVALTNTLFYRYTGQEDIVLGTSVAGRTQQELEGQIGFYVNTVVLRTATGGNKTFYELMQQTREMVLGAFEHQQYPFDLVVDELTVERDMSRSAIFDVLIELQNYQHNVSDAEATAGDPGFVVQPHYRPKTKSIFDLNLEFREYQQQLYLTVNYNTDIYTTDQIRSMSLHLENLARAVINHPKAQLLSYNFLDAAEKNALLAFNPPSPAIIPKDTVASLFNRQVILSAARAAVKDQDATRTYSDIAAAAQQITQLLLRTGYKAPLVGLLMDNTATLPECILGIWQAGGAYLPLDPAQPAPDLVQIVNHARIPVLLTTREYVYRANELQWASAHLRYILCIDSDDIYREAEPVLESMNKEMWELVGDKAADDIDGGGWVNSYTGKHFSREEMDEYADNTYLKIKPYLHPEARVLEIGCASGITLFRLAEETGYYLGTDMSAAILKKNEQKATDRKMEQVAFACMYAHEIDQLEEGDFDIIIINSVIQNFSGVNYLRDVLEQCIRKLSSKGIIYVGDVMDISLKEILLADLSAWHQEHPENRAVAFNGFADHQFYSSTFFDDLRSNMQGVQAVTHSPKIHTIRNEMTQYRFDTILHIDKVLPQPVIEPARFQLDRKHLGTTSADFTDMSSSDGLAYVMYTAVDKGAMITHSHLLSHTIAKTSLLELTAHTTVLHHAAPTMDAAVWQVFATLLAGGRVYTCHKKSIPDTSSLLRIMQRENIHVAQFAPAYLSALLDEASAQKITLPGLKVIATSGEVLPAASAVRCFRLFPHVKLINMYGVTAAAGTVCNFMMTAAPVTSRVPIGTAAANSRIYILNEQLQLCPVGVTGEIYVAGAGVGPGYLHDELLTEKYFLPDTFYPGRKERMFRTGDLARRLADGTLEFRGRLDQQIRIRGQQTDPGEIESKLEQVPGVKGAVARAYTDAQGNNSIAAFVSMYKGYEGTDGSIIRDAVRLMLPEYLIPAVVFVLDTLPLDQQGRIDRTALPDVGTVTTLKITEAPRTLLEQQLAAIWEDILHHRPIGIHDNFFALGGHSLKATRVVSRVKKELFIKLELSQIFTSPTLAQLTEVLSKAGRTKFNKITPAPWRPDYALSHPQKRIWLLEQLEPGMVAYNMPFGYVLTGDLQTAALEKSFALLVARHEVLRTSFRMLNEEPRQVIHPVDQLAFHFRHVDLRQEAAAMETAQRMYVNESITPFDLGNAPLIRAQLLRVQDFRYVLLFTMHHIISDGWSMDVVIRELLTNYQQLLEDMDWQPAALPIQYKDYSEWQQQELLGAITTQSRDYWLNKFRHLPEVMDIPADRPRPLVKSYAGDAQRIMFSPEMTAKLRSFSQQKGVSLYILLVSFVKLLLFRYTNQRDVVLATPVAGRDHADLEDQIGFYINSLVLRVQVEDTWSFNTFLDKVKEEVLTSFEHQFYPFDMLVDALQLPRDMSRSPLFDVMVTYWKYEGSQATSSEGMRVEPLALNNQQSKLDLTYHFIENGHQLGLNIEFCTALFDKDRIVLMGQHLMNLADAVCDAPEQTIRRVPFLTPEEIHFEVFACNRFEVDYQQHTLIHQLFEQQVLRTPHAAAINTNGAIQTFDMLNKAANRLANQLCQRGISKGSIVGVMLDRSDLAVTAILAILKAGAAYLPIDPKYPPERIAYIIGDASLEFIVSNEQYAGMIVEENIQYIMTGDASLTAFSDENLQLPGTPDQMAYVIYTSGSTGNPKGSVLNHANLVSLLTNDGFPYQFTGHDKWLLFHSISFDVSVWEIFCPLFTGGCLYIADTDILHVPERLAAFLVKEKITVLNQVPGVFYQLMYAVQLQEVLPAFSLRYVIFAGEALNPAMLKWWKEQYPAITLVNMYGITETTIHVTYKEIDEDIIMSGESNVGLPMATRGIYILDEARQLVPTGTIGEIAVTGVGVSPGYLTRTALTKERFMDDPYRGSGKMYLSGDLARRLPGGEIIYAGRKDFQVKVRGFRIECGEVEFALIIAGAKQAVVTALEERNGSGKFLAAYLTGVTDTELPQIKSRLSEVLPDHMIPTAFVLMEELPLNANGKTDRRQLPYPEWKITEAAFIAPLNGTEQGIAAIWQQELGVAAVGRTANFFELGGHSLKAVRIISAISKRWQADLGLRDIFLHPTVEALSRVVMERTGKQTIPAIVPALPAAHYAVSHAQKRIWVLSQFEQASLAYNMPYPMIIEGALDIDVLKSALEAIVARHEILRTTFDMVEEELRQFIHPPFLPTVEMHEFRFADNPAVAAAAMVKADAATPFDLKNGPLFRILLARIQDNEYLFMVNMHHIIADGWSMEIFGNELFTLYNACSKGAPHPLPPLVLQYKDYSEWQRQQLQGETMRIHQAYWHHKLSGHLPVLELPAFKARPRVMTNNGKTYKGGFSQEQTGLLQQFSVSSDTSLFIVLLGMLKTLLYRYTAQEDIIIGISSAGRIQQELEPQIGFYINTLAIRSFLSGDLSYLDLQQQVKMNVLEAMEHQVYPFDKLVEELVTTRETSRSAIFDVLVEFQNFENDISRIGDYNDLSDLRIRSWPSENDTSLVDINLFFSLQGGQLIYHINYNTDIYHESLISAFAGHLESMALAVINTPTALLDQFEYVTIDERMLLASFNPGRPEWNDRDTVPALIARQAVLQPGQPAVTDRARTLTYTTLMDAAIPVAHLLRTIGEAPLLAGILMDRSVDFAAAVLGVWQAGHAYLPFDPGSPIERLQEVVKDAGLQVLLTTRQYLHIAQELQWSCPALKDIICTDSNNIYEEEEPQRASMDREMWEVTGENAADDITGGGWINSYTGVPFSREEMDEYAENALHKLAPYLHADTRVLEIGCASGITMFRIAPYVNFYKGVDLSANIIEKNKHRAAGAGLNNVSLECLYAHETTAIAEEEFDVVIINSVVQNFSGYNYLRKVIGQCIQKLTTTGIIFIGDVMDADKKEALIADLRQFKVTHAGQGYNTLTDFPDHQFFPQRFFSGLPATVPAIEAVVHSEKTGAIRNELTAFRFDTILHVNKAVVPPSFTPEYRQLDARHLALYAGAPAIDYSGQDSLAYVIYTSGSTGKPKGAMVQHKGMLNHILSKVKTLSVGPGSKVLQNASQTFDISVWQYFTAAVAGGHTVIYDNELVLTPDMLWQQLVADGITIAEFVPSYLTVLLEEATGAHLSPEALKFLLVTGETVPVELAGNWLKQFPGIPIVNAYGPTEASDDITHHVMTQAPAGERVPLGKPVSYFRIYVTDSAGMICPVGVKGEICVAGIGVGPGYLYDAGRTAEVFVSNPFSSDKDYERMYKTGDIGRWLPDGTLEFFGRKDYQVKIHGYRIEPGETEHKLLQLPGVRMAAVTDREDAHGNKYLAAYVCLHPEAGTSVEELKAGLLKLLPEYMVPAHIMVLDALPLNSSGKINRRALPDPVSVRDNDTYKAPQTPTQRKLAALWEDILQYNPVGIADDFFEVGGHSLKATRLVSGIFKTFQVKVAFREIFTSPTIAALSEIIDRKGMTEERAIFPAPQQTYYKASHAQRRLWILSRFGKASLAFNLEWAYRFEGNLDVAALQNAWHKVIQRHESLRTVFIEIDGEPHQVILPADEKLFTLDVTDLEHTPDKAALVEYYKTAEVTTAFDLEKGPLIRGRILKTDPGVHIFLFTIHHIVADGWSLEILSRELMQLYTVFSNGGTDPLPPLPVQYKDYTMWQLNRQQGERYALQEQYWHRQLGGVLPQLDLPFAKIRPAIQTYNGAQLYFRFTAATTTALNQAARQFQGSLFMVITAVLKTVFFRYTGQTDIIVGTSASGRLHKELEGQIGFYLNTLALRTTFEAADTFSGMLGKVKETVLDAFDHQEYPFDGIVEQLVTRRDLSRSPVYDVLVLLQNIELEKTESHAGRLADLSVSQLDAAAVASQGDLLFNFTEKGDELHLALLYNTDIFNSSDIERMAAMFEQVALYVAAHPEEALCHIPLLNTADEALLQSYYGPEASLPQVPADMLIAAMVHQFAAKEAIREAHSFLTYEALNDGANRMAHHLGAIAGGADRLAVVMLPRSAAFIQAVLAIWKTGMAYVPVSEDWPLDRIHAIIRDAAPVAVITHAKGLQTLQSLQEEENNIHWIDAAAWKTASEGHPSTAPEVVRSLDDLAYVIYTSGSTGKSKGAMVEHRGMLNHLLSKQEILQTDDTSRVLLNAQLTFDISVWQCFVALLTGGTTVIYSEEQVLDISNFISTATSDKLSIAEVVPSYLQVLLDEHSQGTVQWPHLRYMLVTGEKLSWELTDKWFRYFPAVPLINAYGPTEASDDITHHVMLHAPAQKVIPLGSAIRNMHIYITDPYMELCLPGMKGEICVAGAGVGRGYLGDAGRTAAVFLPNPFEGGAYQRLYRTGDIGRWREDGVLEFFGREDQQVKIRGYRIELEEIENTLLRMGGIQSAVVKDFQDNEDAAYLVAFICFTEEVVITEEDIKLRLLEKLPEYMVPSGFVTLAAMPLTGNGKIDRKQLTAPSAKFSSAMFTPPVTKMELQMAEIWKAILGYDNISTTDNFFDIGGQSLKATQVISRIHKILDIRVDLAAFFQYPTIRGIIQYMEALYPEKYMPILPVPPSGKYPASRAQKRLWMICQQPGQSVSYNLPSGYRISGPLDIPAFARAFDALVDRHESLRTVFTAEEGEIWQHVRTPAESGFRMIIKNMTRQHLTPAALQQLAEEEANQPFDLENGPLLRVTLLILGEEDAALLFTMHHIITDGWSFNILVSDLMQQYHLFRNEGDATLPPAGLHYRDFSYWQEQLLTEERTATLRAFWLSNFRQLPAPLNPGYDRPAPAVPTYAGDQLNFVLPDATVAGIRALLKNEWVTAFVFQVAITAILLRDISGQDDIVLGIPTSGREHPDLEKIVGFFVNTLPVHIRLNPGDSLLQVLHQAAACCMEAIRHQAYPLDAIVSDLQLSGKEHPLFNVMLIPENTDITVGGDTGTQHNSSGTDMLEVVQLESLVKTSRMDLSFHFYESRDSFCGHIAYRTELFDAESVSLIKEKLVSLIEKLLSNKSQSLNELKLLDRITPAMQLDNIVNDLDF